MKSNSPILVGLSIFIMVVVTIVASFLMMQNQKIITDNNSGGNKSTPVAPLVTTTITITAIATQQTTETLPMATLTPMPDEATVESVKSTVIVCATPPSSWISYQIQKGDTLSELAQRTKTTVEEIKVVNCIVSSNIFMKQTISLPFYPATSTAIPVITIIPTSTMLTLTSTPPITPTVQIATPTEIATSMPTITITNTLLPPPTVMITVPSPTPFTEIVTYTATSAEISYTATPLDAPEN